MERTAVKEQPKEQSSPAEQTQNGNGRKTEVTKYIVLLVAILIVATVGSCIMTYYAPQPASQTEGMTSDAPAQPAVLSQEPINLNTADLAELDRLPGVGEVTARRILTFREEYGAFRSIEELRLVPGIGEKTFEELKGMITVEDTEKTE